ncbi:MAG: hypothetical protein C0487_12120 [Leptothrix sp. (in: Bacteria)]|nr:hypothetical protein [Leptothrix sp. (in: b-proteobacteria)]
MKIRKIKINNFRGVKELDWNLPKADIFCLIGKGDSSKSTILEAIRYAFHPQWNLTLSDSDFHQCKVAESIVIEVTIGELTEDFCSLDKYGRHLRGWDAASLKLTDEPEDHHESVLTVRLTVDKDLEPKWVVFCDRHPDGVPFKQGDRNRVSVGLIGAYSEKQLSWATGTALAKLTEAQSLNELLANASRTARASLDADRPVSLKNFDAAAEKSQDIAKRLGVPVSDAYKAHLDLASINLKVGGLALHDGDIPLRQLGLGSRRMLLCGIQKMGLEEGHITLFDEMEFGLEPHRITRLIKHVREDKRGQYFLTTHSPTVLRELTVNDLYIVHSKAGAVRVIPAYCEGLVAHEAQGRIRSSAEAFLSKKVVVCEGATEVGFLRGYDDHQVGKGKDPFAYHGVSLLNAGGASKIKALAEAFKLLGYDVCVVADGDAEKQFSPAHETELKGKGISVHVWTDKLSLERRAFQDLPWISVIASVKLAQITPGLTVYENVRSKYQKPLDEDVGKWGDSPDLRLAIGNAAMDSGWFKDISRGDLWVQAISASFDDAGFLKKDIATKLALLWAWAEHV